ncbi:SAM-dependent methyltransferase [Halorientalis sp. IM1011]|uniref:class I SAM-dependent methyltransferase n=1 Tax=Halorientalis sp. IM1011 TaxID=1932360 RepID=UPI00097CC3BF|nr:class I SAM-dependent methyltransferase [Halorientalis sp. IM1011]AQL42072.1 SAM-dependent methyltransferase [Halorientalis sp. IM1011]
MGHHTFDAGKAAKLEDAAARYQSVSREELLWGLDLTGAETVVDLGSGTGFYTDDIAPHADRVYAVDIQEEMHDHYREKGVPENVELVTSGIEDLPFDDDELDRAVSTMTYHEFATDEALAELARVLASGGRLVVADWSADGTGEDGPPLSERFSEREAATALEDAGFEIEFRATRPETFLIVGTRR